MSQPTPKVMALAGAPPEGEALWGELGTLLATLEEGLIIEIDLAQIAKADRNRLLEYYDFFEAPDEIDPSIQSIAIPTHLAPST